MRSAVGIARQALDDEGGRAGKVALSLGAYGACMVPSQEYGGRYDAAHRSQAQLREWHLRRLRVFQREEACWGSVDFVAFETLPVLQEVGAVREVMGDVSLPLDDGRAESGPAVEKEFWISCVFPGEGNCLPDGSSVDDVVAAMLGSKEGARRPMGVGINCTRITKIESLVLEFENSIQGMVGRGELGEEEWPALVMYPDGTKGEVYNTVSKEWEVVGNGDGEAWADSVS